ncbi:MAG TPA: MFS transporter, partial [Solirubrobacteraceae bacterium]|nr:MFS transporter [Solirubrobacteraceae bacterium]
MTESVAEEPLAPVPGGPPGRLRGLAVDIAPLRTSAEFRRLWAGQAITFTGTQITNVAVPVQVYAMTRSSFAVGALGIVALVPLVISGLLGSSLVDAMDRRRLVLATATCSLIASGLLVAQQELHWGQLWLLYVVVGVQNGVQGIDSPARRTFIPRLLPPSQIPAANALTQLSSN